MQKIQQNVGKTVTVNVPGTVSNLVCGFDIMGLCLEEPYDLMHVKLIDEAKVIINNTNGFDLPTDPTQNTAGAPLLEIINRHGNAFGFEVTIDKRIKPGSGLGSSAASAAGAVVAANHLLGNIYNNEQLVDLAMYGEVIASGARHADNLAPCIFGGVTLIRSTSPLDVINIPSPDFYITVVHPQIEVKTSYARSILPTEVPLKSAITQWANVAGLVAGFFKNDMELIKRSLQDVIVEPVRKKLIPGYDDVKTLSMEVGALGGGISGAGPSMFMISADNITARRVEVVMEGIYTKLGINYKTYVSKVSNKGARVVT